MKAIRVQRPGVVGMDDVALPEPAEGQVRIRTACCAICATDLGVIDGWERTPYPTTPGHEWCGVVDAVGTGVTANLIGRKCVGDNILSCGKCAACRSADGRACLTPQEVGFELPGAYGQFFLTEASKLRFPDPKVPSATATLAEPLAVVLRGLGKLRPPPRVGPAAIFGDGPIGLLTVLTLHEAGTGKIILVGGRKHKLALGRAFGAAETHSYKQPTEEIIRRLHTFAPEGFSCAVEASGSVAACQVLLDVAAQDGELLLLGDYGEASVQLRLDRLLHKELHLVGSNTGTGAWDDAVAFLNDHHEILGGMITHVFDAREYEAALKTVREKRDECIKVVLKWADE